MYCDSLAYVFYLYEVDRIASFLPLSLQVYHLDKVLTVIPLHLFFLFYEIDRTALGRRPVEKLM